MSEDQHARVRPRSRNFLVRLFRKINDLVNNNPESSQFWGSIISSAITLLALLITVIFSWKALSESQKQNDNAKQQLNLAVSQFKSSQKQHSEDSITAANKEIIANDRFIKDTTKQSQREREQERRNQLQDAANKQQYELNKSQLNAVQVQANIAKQQFNQQQQQYKQQTYEQRPVFNIDSPTITKINSVKSTIGFSFSNQGIRPAHVDSMVLAYYNSKYLCFDVIISPSNLDLISQRISQITGQIQIFNDCVSSNLTTYYLLIYYKDIFSGTSKVEPIFFNYSYSNQHKFNWGHNYSPTNQEFIKLLNKKKIPVF